MLSEILNLKYILCFELYKLTIADVGFLGHFNEAIASYANVKLMWTIEDREYLCQVQTTFIIPQMLIRQ